MLSIVIPVYNYPILPLVERLHQEASTLNIPFEILVCDDASHSVFDNESIVQLQHTRLLKNQVNRHVAYTRNRLLAEAQYPWVLLLDADTYPLAANFIQTYLTQRDQGLFFQGGFTYQSTEKKQTLRLKYGIEIEQHKHIHSCCNLFFNQQQLQLQFDESIQTYGYEDTLFFLQVQKRDIAITRLNNKVAHLSTESNATYLERTQQACNVLATLVLNQTIHPQEIQLSHRYSQLQKSHLTALLTGIDLLIGKWITRNLLSETPSMLLFKLFKLIAYHKAIQAIQKTKPLL
ncbi:glycosyltransferase family A protein [Myroides sp. WP-1]|uniref:glycosyltransferase family 2 protein n=1 Tax=Myroides sp. WP-1 TaxID=2759944 RepID=UPI0015F9AE0F|nr:glycosyltransferase family A protein [Myroides sp. WP-1]MBB1139051.1 glycosyltransferase family 2 protein [Myroides sp. WP-1]